MSSEERGMSTETQASQPAPQRGSTNASKGANSRRRRGFDVRKHGGRVAIGLVALLLLNVVFWYFGVRPVRAEIASLQSDEQSADQARRRAEKTVEALRATREHVDAVSDHINDFFDGMLSTRRERAVSFQRALTEVGSKFRVRPEQTAVSVTDLEQEGIEVMGFVFPIRGGYQNLRYFLAELESLDQFLIVRQIALQGGREGGRQLRLNVSLETYFNAPGMREEMARQREWEKRTRDSRRRGGRRR